VKWDVFHCSETLKEELCKQLTIPPLVAQLLIKRGITTKEDGEKFLFPLLHHLYDPFLMKDMDKGVERVIHALQQREHITIYGDYDADGVTACALLVDFLRELGSQPFYYIPHRLHEGYGLNLEAIDKVAAQGTQLLICVDCGIGDHQAIQRAQQLNIDTIVIDHHEPPPLPCPAYAVLDPLQSDCPFPFKGLAGVGLAFYFVMALRSKLREAGFWSHRTEPNLRRYLDLVALGTIADIVPLIDTNRVLVTFGLKELEDSVRPGLIALKEVSGIGAKEISTGQVAFRLAPRLNAGGRMTNGTWGVDLLVSKDYAQARGIAEELDQANRDRQSIEERIYQEAKNVIERDRHLNRKSLILSSDEWHPGVIGIVASKLAEKFWRPTILIALDGDEGKGSARSVAGFHIYEALHECAEHLMGFGGHKYAAGLKIHRDKIQPFRDSFEETIRRKLGQDDFIQTIAIDAEIDLEDITPELLRYLSLFSPYGQANPKPIFVTREKLQIRNVKILRQKTLKFTLQKKEREYEVIGFGMAGLSPQLPSEARIAFHPQVNEWLGVKRLQLELRDVASDIEDG
jgi:single-stranded-DNA-specific exonuclease